MIVAWDTETELIRPACLAPPLVCVTWQRPGEPAQIAHVSDAEALIRDWLESGAALVGHNVAYDLAVVIQEFPALAPAIFAAYEADRVTDTMIRQQILDIAGGCYRGSVNAKGRRVSYEYTLEALAKRCAGLVLEKDAWRLSYASFRDVPLVEWADRARVVQAEARGTLAAVEAELVEALEDGDKPRAKALTARRDGLASMIGSDPSRCTEYPLDDARATLAVWQAQEAHAAYLADQYRQARAAFALHLESAWGLRTDAAGVASLRAAVEAEHAELDAELVAAGLVREDGTRDTKAAKARMIAACAAIGIPVVRTDAHFAPGADCGAADDCAEHVCLDADACERAEDELLAAYADRTTLGKQLSNDIPALEGGTIYPIHTRYGLAATGRATSAKPNIQNQSKRPGYREAFVPRPGFVFAQADYPTLELYTLAQCCVAWLGRSRLADTLNAGLDPHLRFAALLIGLDYEVARATLKDPTSPKHAQIKQARQLAKAANFGFPGGMGIPKFVATTRKGMSREAFESLGLDEDRARRLKGEWFDAYPEMPAYFARVNASCADGLADVETLFTGRRRGRATYCAACNNGFQALGSDCAKRAAWLIATAQYAEPASALYGCRAVAFVHDEFISEVPDDARAHEAAYEQARLMADGANTYLRDVPIPAVKIEPVLMRRWSKKAEPRFDASGRLVPWHE